MPAKSKAQRIVMAIAEHEPDKLYAQNKGAADMSQSQLHDFAATPSKNLPEHANSKNVYAKKYKGIMGKKNASRPY